MCSPCDLLKSATLPITNIYCPIQFREELSFAMEGLPFYKPVIDQYSGIVRNTEYEYILYLQGDTRIKKFISSIDGTSVDIPLVPAVRRFDYFVPYLSDNWGDEVVEIEFTEKELKYIRDQCIIDYNEVKDVLSFFCAKPIAHMFVIFPPDYSDMEMLEELGRLLKASEDNIDPEFHVSRERRIKRWFPEFSDGIPDALYYFKSYFGTSNEEKIYGLAANYCRSKRKYKNEFAYLCLDGRDNIIIVEKFMEAYKDEIDRTLNGSNMKTKIVSVENSDSRVDSFAMLEMITGDDKDIRYLAAFYLFDTSYVYAIVGNIFTNTPYVDQHSSHFQNSIRSIEELDSRKLHMLKKSMENMSKYGLCIKRIKVVYQIILMIKLVEDKRKAIEAIFN